MCIDDLPNVVQHSTDSLYADDAKLYMNVNNHEDCRMLQCDIDAVGVWCI